MESGGIYKGVTSTYTTAELDASGVSIKGMPIGAVFELGPKKYKLVKAGGTIAVNDIVKYNGATTTFGVLGAAVIATAAATDSVAGVAETAITSGDFGWITVAGVAQGKVVDGVAIDVQLAASGTAGAAQKAPNTTTVAEKCFGHLLTANSSGATAVRPIQLQGLV